MEIINDREIEINFTGEEIKGMSSCAFDIIKFIKEIK